MASDKRNTLVVITLVTAMTAGLVVLLNLEKLTVPSRVNWALDPALTARDPLSFREVEIAYAEPLPDLQWDVDPDDTLCVVRPDDSDAGWSEGGPRVRMLVLGTGDGQVLGEPQKLKLLQVLSGLRADVIPVRLAPSLALNDSPPARDLRQFLERKGLIRKS